MLQRNLYTLQLLFIIKEMSLIAAVRHLLQHGLHDVQLLALLLAILSLLL